MSARTFFWAIVVAQVATISVFALMMRGYLPGAELPPLFDQAVTVTAYLGLFGYPVLTFIVGFRARLLKQDFFSICLLQAALSLAHVLALLPGTQ